MITPAIKLEVVLVELLLKLRVKPERAQVCVVARQTYFSSPHFHEISILTFSFLEFKLDFKPSFMFAKAIQNDPSTKFFSVF